MLLDPYRSSISPQIRRIKFKRSLSKSMNTLDESSPLPWSEIGVQRASQLPQKPFLRLGLDILRNLFFRAV